MLTASQAVKIIKENTKVAIVGLSPKEDRPSFRVGHFLLDHGQSIIPIHPSHDEIIGLAAKPSLADLEPGEVDWIDLFVNPARLMDLMDDILRLKPKLVWCQLGVVNEEFNAKLEEAGIDYIADHCPKIEWSLHD